MGKSPFSSFIMDSCVLTCYCCAVFSQEQLQHHLPECPARSASSPVHALVEEFKQADPQQLLILRAELKLEVQLLEHKLRPGK